MIKRTLYFGTPAYLSLKLGQLVIRLPEPSQAHVHAMSKAITMEKEPHRQNA